MGYYNNGGFGDKKLIYRTDIIKQTPPYPIFDNEKVLDEFDFSNKADRLLGLFHLHAGAILWLHEKLHRRLMLRF